MLRDSVKTSVQTFSRAESQPSLTSPNACLLSKSQNPNFNTSLNISDSGISGVHVGNNALHRKSKHKHQTTKNNDNIWRYSDNKFVKRTMAKYCTAFNMMIQCFWIYWAMWHIISAYWQVTPDLELSSW